MITREIAERAVWSLFLEVSLAPKPGLVTPYNNGSHKDMNFRMFADSALALFNYFEECAAIGEALALGPPNESLFFLKKAGIEAEKVMYSTTSGVNTHKGAIYLLGFLCAAAGRSAKSRKRLFPPPKELALIAASFVGNAVERELSPLFFQISKTSEPLTAGERAYIVHGFTGARGEVERGYPLALNALNFLKSRLSRLSFRMALADALFFIIARNEDTNLFARGGIEGLKTAQVLAKKILEKGGVSTSKGLEKVCLTETIFVEKNLSPGGSADILSSTVFLFLTESATIKRHGTLHR